MIYISHRGNTFGPNPEKENHPDYIIQALEQGYNVEIDVWLVNDKFLLGHDKPQYEVNEKFLLNENLWHHAKDIKTLYYLNKMKSNYLINCFFHNTDDCTLTSGGWIWTYPGKELTDHSIAVLPEKVLNWDLSVVDGICSDYVENYKLYSKYNLNS